MVCGTDVYFWRQTLVLIADCSFGVSVGLVLSFPAILNPVIQSQNSTDIRATPSQASWLTSAYGFAGMIGFCVLPGIMQKYGRKVAHLAMNISVAIGFVIFALANDVITLYIGRSIQGMSLCGVYLTSIILAEYSHPTRRGFFITFHKGTVALGSIICHASVLFCTWRQTAIIAVFGNLVGIILTLLWVESPAYFAMRGKYEECDKAFTYLYGNSPSSKKELEDLISAQEERRKKEKRKDKNENELWKICKILVRKDFLKPFFIIVLLTVIIDSGGRYYNLAYIVQIIKDITGDNSLGIYCSIGLDVLTIVASWTSAYFITKFSRRVILLSFGYLSVVLMFLITFIVYTRSPNPSGDGVWLTPCIILINSFIVNFGIIPICFTVSGEIYPLEFRGVGFTATGIVFTLLYGVTMKFTPMMMEKTGIEGTYGIYGLCLLICLVILHFILIETKDKTLQEIEDEIKGVKRRQNTKETLINA